MTLEGKRIIVTGAARGIGLATAAVLVAQGARVGVADIDLDRAIAAAEGLGAPAGAAIPLRVDVAQPASVSQMVAEATVALSGLDGMFNNAGIIHPEDGDVQDITDAAWQTTLAVNLSGVFQCCRFGLPALLESGGGAIVNNASIVGMLGSCPSQIAYTAAKGGVIAMSREIAVAYARRGVRVNSISPGVTRTAMGDQLTAAPEASRDSERFRHIPMGRFADPAEIAQVVAFLLSDAAGYITAQNVPVDGGITGAYLCPPFPQDA